MAQRETKTPSLIDVLNNAIEKRLCELHTAMPGIISSYDPKTNLAVVKPALKRKYIDEPVAIDLPLISNVPVAFPRLGDAHLRLPVTAGDEGMIIFQERSIDLWLEMGATVDPDDPRKFQLSDGVFYPGLSSKKKPMDSKADPKSVELKNKLGFIEILPSGKFKLGNGTQELFDLNVRLIKALNRVFTATGIGPQLLVDPLGDLPNLIAEYEALKG